MCLPTEDCSKIIILKRRSASIIKTQCYESHYNFICICSIILLYLLYIVNCWISFYLFWLVVCNCKVYLCIAATEALNTCYITSTYATCSVEEIVAAAPNGYRWFQLYVYRDRKLSEHIVHRVEGLGYKALVLTVDVPYTGKRRDDIRNQFKLPPHLKVKNFDGVFQVIVFFLMFRTTKKENENIWV